MFLRVARSMLIPVPLRFSVGVLLALALVLVLPTKVIANTNLDFGPFSYTAKDKVLRQVGYELALAMDAEVRFEGSVDPELPVLGSWNANRFRLVLDGVADTLNLDWLVVNKVLVFSSRSDRSTVTAKFSGMAAERRVVKGFLRDTLNDKAFRTAYTDDEVTINGPRWFVDYEVTELLAEIESTMDEDGGGESVAAGQRLQQLALSGTETDEIGVMTFKLRHAWVDDKTFTSGSTETLVPGVATLARSLSAGRRVPTLTADVGGGAEIDEFQATDQFEPSIFGDVRTNSLVVRDYLRKRPSYAALIEILDRPSDLIQLEAYIVDINRSKLTEIGISFQNRSGDTLVQVSPGAVTSPNNNNNGNGGGNNANNASGFAANLVLDQVGGSQLLANLRLLETTGDSQIVSVPSVLAMNNIEAAISRRESFFITVNSERDADVIPVTAETRLLVTPSVIEQPNSGDDTLPEIKLLINIQDAAIDGVSGFGIANTPRTKEFQVSTQAVVTHGDLILVGGQIINQQSSSKDKVPVLGDLPLLGRLFRSDRTDDLQFIRVFMIKPTVVDQEAG